MTGYLHEDWSDMGDDDDWSDTRTGVEFTSSVKTGVFEGEWVCLYEVSRLNLWGLGVGNNTYKHTRTNKHLHTRKHITQTLDE